MSCWGYHSYLSSGLSFCRMRRASCTMDGFYLLYLLMILLVRSGDVETNPGPDRIVSEREFFKLSKQIDPSFYKEVGINFDIPNAELVHIEKESRNTSDALMTVFTRWRDKQPPGTDIRALLAEGLKNSDLGSLSGELLAGSLVPNKTSAPVTRPRSQTQSLSPDLIKRCADDFKFKYRTTFCKIRDDPLDPDSIVPLKDMYTNLVLEEEYRKKRKRKIEYSDLYKLEVNGEFPKRIMVQGEAGAGKTTFCAKIAWDWINNSPVLPKFKWVLVVPLREAKQYTIGEIAKSYLSKDNPATACQITDYIRSNPREVFIAFDGLDEFKGKLVQEGKAGSKSECHQPKSADHTKARSESKKDKNKRQKLTHPESSSATLQPIVTSAEASGSSSERGDIALTDILRSDELATCPVLVTSRPWKVTEIRDNDSLRNLYTFIHVEGFNKENVEVYIHKYFPEDVAKANQLIQLTKNNVIISENMAQYPIYIAMLCLMWRELGDEKQEKLKSLQTFSQIFDEMFEFLKVHYAQKESADLDSPSFQAFRSQIEKLMEPVAKVAFTGLLKNILSFKEGDLEQCSDSIETACRVGVLSKEKKLSSIHNKSSPFLQSTIFFPHKLFQEYMAGVHLASLYESDRNEFNRLIEQVVLPRMEEFRYLLYFTVSRDKTIANHVMKCMLQGGISGEDEMDFLVDVSFESQDLDTAALVRRRMSSLRIWPVMTGHTVAGYVFTGLGLHKNVINHGVHGQFGPNISHDIAEIICFLPSLKRVSLQGVALHSDFYAVLANKGNKSKVKILELQDVRCPTSASSQHLAEALCSMPNLAYLSLEGHGFQEEFYSALNAKASTLQDPFPQISNGNFMFNGEYQADLDSFLKSLTDSRGQESRWRPDYTTVDGNQVHCDFLTNSPEELTDALQDDEAVIACGIRFSSSGAKLPEPFKVTLDHNAHFSNPRRAEIIFYTRNKDSNSFERIPASTNGYPRCVVRAKDFDLYVDHFCTWWPVAKIKRYFVGKRVKCTPYVLPPVEKELTHFVLLCIYDDLSDVIQKIKEEMTKYTKLHPPQPMFVKWEHGDIVIKMFDGPKENEKEIDKKKLGKRDIHLFAEKLISFEVKPLEAGMRQKFLKFTLNQIQSLSDPTSLKFSLPYDDIETARTTAEAQSVGVSMLSQIDLESEGSSSRSRPRKMKAPSTRSRAPQDDSEISEKQSKIDLVSDGILDKLSKNMPPGTYTTLCRHLGIKYNEADSILARFNNDCQRATRHCLAQWKTRTGGGMAQLKVILVDAEVGDLVKYIE